jgi:hypothetical protein
VNPRAEHLLYTLFKRNVGTTVTVAEIFTIVLVVAPAVGIFVGIATALLVVWWILFLIDG